MRIDRIPLALLGGKLQFCWYRSSLDLVQLIGWPATRVIPVGFLPTFTGDPGAWFTVELFLAVDGNIAEKDE